MPVLARARVPWNNYLRKLKPPPARIQPGFGRGNFPVVLVPDAGVRVQLEHSADSVQPANSTHTSRLVRRVSLSVIGLDGARIARVPIIRSEAPQVFSGRQASAPQVPGTEKSRAENRNGRHFGATVWVPGTMAQSR